MMMIMVMVMVVWRSDNDDVANDDDSDEYNTDKDGKICSIIEYNYR